MGQALWVRVPANEPGMIGKVLDLGFKGLIRPMADSVDDARRLVAATRFLSPGERSYGQTRALLYERPTGFVERSNLDVLVLAMIETREALRPRERDMFRRRLDGVYIRPNDLGISMGHGAAIDREDGEVLAAFDHILAAARARRKFAGIHTASVDHAARMLARGLRHGDGV